MSLTRKEMMETREYKDFYDKLHSFIYDYCRNNIPLDEMIIPSGSRFYTNLGLSINALSEMMAHICIQDFDNIIMEEHISQNRIRNIFEISKNIVCEHYKGSMNNGK